MSNIHPFNSKDEILEQASLWISQIDRGLSEQECQHLRRWAAQSESHKQALFELAALWDEMSVLNELSQLFPKKGLIKAPTQRISNFAIAASIFAMMLVGFVISANLSVSLQAPIANNSFSKIYRTKVGEQATHVLPDKSIIQLNTNTSIEVVYTATRRQIILNRGEGRFSVAKDRNRPFSVVAGEKAFTALGTVFNVQKQSSADFELVVTEGKVMIAPAEMAVKADDFDNFKTASREKMRQSFNADIVTSGEKAVIQKSITAPIKQLSLSDVQQDLAWQQGMLIFNGESLEQALNEVSRYTSTRFELTDPKLKTLKVAGVFKAGDIIGLLDSLEANLSVQHKRLGEHRVSLSLSQQQG